MKRAPEETAHQTYFDLCRQVSKSSTDRETHVGCVIVKGATVLAQGCNTLPAGINDPTGERSVRPGKYDWMEHAERNAIYSAARSGTKLAGSRMYVDLVPCVECAKAIIQAGIAEVIVSAERMSSYQSDKYSTQHALAELMLKEAGVTVWRV